MNLTDEDDPGTSPAPTLATVIRALPGGSQSRLVLCSNRKTYVLKTHPNPQGNNILANEAIESILLHGLGLRTPRGAQSGSVLRQ
jgi:hypothetical protein